MPGIVRKTSARPTRPILQNLGPILGNLGPILGSIIIGPILNPGPNSFVDFKMSRPPTSTVNLPLLACISCSTVLAAAYYISYRKRKGQTARCLPGPIPLPFIGWLPSLCIYLV